MQWSSLQHARLQSSKMQVIKTPEMLFHLHKWTRNTCCFMQDFQTSGATLFIPLHKPSVGKEGLWVLFLWTIFVLLQLPVYCWTGKRSENRWSLAFTVESRLWANSSQGRQAGMKWSAKRWIGCFPKGKTTMVEKTEGPIAKEWFQ